MANPKDLPIELIDLNKMVPYDKNVKKHPPEQIAKIAASIKEFGVTQPIVLWKDMSIIQGHGRRLAGLSLGMTKFPTVVRKDLSRAQADALRLADNRVAGTEYDTQMMAEELQRLVEENPGEFLIEAMGFDERELDFTLADLGEIDDNFFTEDTNEAVAEQSRSNESAAEDTDKSTSPLADAIGVKRVTVEQSRQIRKLMEQQPNASDPVKALIDALEAKVAA